jgi:putative transposase
MDNDLRQQRISAVQRYLAGESPEAICASLGKSKVWLYKWFHRYNPNDESWSDNQSTQPKSFANRTLREIEEIVILVRLSLYNRDLFHGAQAILWELEDLDVQPLPSLRTINRILSRNSLTHRRTGRYESKGTPYPKLPSVFPNQTHQADMVGPCYLRGPIRFYSLNVLDMATERCGLVPCLSRTGQTVINGFWAIWRRLGIPSNIQVDNALYFYGSPTYPRGMGPLIRLCLHHGVEPWFIPMAEPWRNGTIEKFNDFYQQKFLDKLIMSTVDELKTGSLAFEQRHNSKYRYSKLGGKTPLKALSFSKQKLRFPPQENAPKHRMKKPVTGRYHLVRLIRSDQKLNVFGELFPVPPETEYQYVVATIDVKEQKLKLFLDKSQIDEIEYKLR